MSPRITPCKVSWIPESSKFLPLESRILGIQLKKIWNPKSSTWNPESMAWNLESKTVLDSFRWGKQETEKEFLVGQALQGTLASSLLHCQLVCSKFYYGSVK